MYFTQTYGQDTGYRTESNKKKRDINDIPINNCALWACYGVSNWVKSNRKIYQLIESIKDHINDITNLHLTHVLKDDLFFQKWDFVMLFQQWRDGQSASTELSQSKASL